jgi:branched-chain amino acid transport system ATP-binding protein
MPRIAGGGTTLVLVEQDVGQAVAVADRVVCLLEGRVALERAAGETSRHEIAEAYFGVRG